VFQENFVESLIENTVLELSRRTVTDKIIFVRTTVSSDIYRDHRDEVLRLVKEFSILEE